MSIFLPFSFGRRSDPPYNAFYYTGKDQTFNFIGGLTYTIYAWGAAGGVASTALGGYGAYVSGVFTPSTSGTGTITIGPVGSQGAFVSHSAPTYGGGGYGPNGGANGGGRASFFVNTTPILVAAGGGGAAYDGTFSPVGGGNGGAVYSSSTFTGNGIGGSGVGGGGATSSSGGAAGNAGGNGTGPATNVGTLTLGGGGAGNAGGGGAGYYGGGGGGNNSGVGGGGGGSSYINTNYFSCISAAQGSSIPVLSSFTSGSTVYNLYNAGGYPAGVATSANTGSAMMIIIQNPATFNPTYIAGCSIWLDGADTSSNSMTFSSSSNLSVWKDKSGSSNNFSASGTVANITDGGYSVVSFPSGGVMTSTNSVSVSSNSALFVVSKLTSIPNGVGRIVEFPNISSGDFAVRYNSPSNGLIGTPTVAGNNSNDFANNKYFVNGVFNPNYTLSSFSNVYTLIDSMISTGSGTSTIKLSDNVYNQYFVGNIAEFIYYPNGGLTNSQRRQVEMYLASKWGLGTPLSTFSPANISSLSLWFDAADTSTISSNGSNITTWKNKGNSGVNALSNASYTTATTGVNTLNGLNVVTWPSSSQMMLSNLVLSNQAKSVFTVFRLTSGTIVMPITSTVNYGYQMYTSYGSGLWYYRISAITGINDYVRYSNSTNISNTAILVDGVNSTSSSSNIGLLNATSQSLDFNVGANSFLTSAQLYTLNNASYTTVYDLAELIFYDGALTTAQRQQVEGYLAWKWGIYSNLPSTHPSYYSPPAAQVTFTPAQLSSLILWLDAADSSTITLSSSTVTQWRDKSIYNGLMTSGSPTYSSTRLNSLPAITTTTATPTYMTGSFGNGLASTQYYTLFFVFNYTAYSGGSSRLFGMAASGNNDYQYSGFNCSLANTGSPIAFTFQNCSGSISPNSFTSSTGPTIVTVTVSGNTIIPSAFGIGTPSFGQSGNSLGADWSEVLIFNTTLTTAQQNQVEGYLAWKWGLQGSLPSSHPYYKISP